MSTDSGVFAVLALDHLSALSAMVRPRDPDAVSDAQLAETKVQLVEWLAEQASGVLIDPIVGLEAVTESDALDATKGLLVGLEDGDYASLDQTPRLFKGWNVGRAKRAGANAIKCSFLYDPFAPSEEAHQFVTDLVAECEQADLPLFAEPLMPPTPKADRRTVVVATARNIGALGADILKLEFPGALDGRGTSAEWRDACTEVTEAIEQPWTLLSAGEAFDTFVQRLTIACQAGASGYVAGRTVWQNVVAEGVRAAGPEVGEAKHRLSVLSEIAESLATPWMERFGPSAEARADGWSGARGVL